MWIIEKQFNPDHVDYGRRIFWAEFDFYHEAEKYRNELQKFEAGLDEYFTLYWEED